jgi:hypothetical protein
VVGRFVEQQEVGGAHQRLRQVQAHPPAAGKAAHPLLHLRTVEAQPGQQFACPGIRAVAAGIVQLAVQARQRMAVMRSLGRGQLGLDAAQLDVAIEHVVDRQAIERIDLLAHMRNAPVRRYLTIPAVGTELATQKREQARLAGTVGADEAGFLPGMQGEVGAVQQTLGASL